MSISTNAQQSPTCAINCIENLTVQASPGQTTQVVNYNLDYSCESTGTGICDVTYPGNNFYNLLPNSNYNIVANDFDLPDGGTYTVTRIIPHLLRFSYGSDIYIYQDNQGKPGTLITSFTNTQYTSQTIIGNAFGYDAYEVVIDLPTPVSLTGGKYWVAINAQGPIVSWESTNTITTETSYTSQNGGTTWSANDGNDGVFSVIYECGQTVEPELTLSSGLASGAEFPVGTTEVTYNLVLNDAIINTCTFSVIVEGDIAPACSLVCPADIITAAEAGQARTIVTYDIAINCENPETSSCAIEYPGNNFYNLLLNSNYNIVANDFDIPEGSTYTVTGFAPHFFRFSYGSDLYIYEDNFGVPGTLITSYTNLQYASQNIIGNAFGYDAYEVVINLPTPLELSAGKYWFATNAQGPLISWESTDNVTTQPSYTSQNGGSTWSANTGNDGVFDVIYDCEGDSGAELVLVSGFASGSEFPIGTTEVVHNLVYNDTVIDTCIFNVTVDNVSGTGHFNQNKFLVYPNPASNVITISGDLDLKSISIFDLSGRTISTEKVIGSRTQIDISGLSAGTYLLNVNSENHNETVRIIKQ